MVLLFAHRGGTDGGHPENSIAAMAEALANGLSLESDVRLSLDGEPVLVHDSYLVARGSVPRRVRRMSAAHLARYGVATLSQLYEELGSDFELSIDVKDTDAIDATLAVAEAADAVRRLWLVHDSIHTLQRIRRRSSDVRLMHETRLLELARNGIDPLRHMDLLKRFEVDAQNTHWGRWTPELVDAAHARGLLAFGSIAQTPKQMRRALALGLDGLYTDHGKDLVAVAAQLQVGGEPDHESAGGIKRRRASGSLSRMWDLA